MQKVKVAAVQMGAETGKIDVNMKKALKYIDEAADNGARLVVLPEGVCQGCVYDNFDDQWAASQPVPEGDIVQQFIEKSKEKNVYIVAGMIERLNGKLYNTAVLTGPEGYVGKHQKLHLFDMEKKTMEPGECGLQVFDTAIGKIGILICWDVWFPEDARLLMLQGADLICLPTGWVVIPELTKDPEDETRPIANYLCMAQSHMNFVHIVAADRCGTEGPVKWAGHSVITMPQGWFMAEGSEHDEEILYAEVDLREIKEGRCWSPRVHLVSDRRTDVYDEMLGSDMKPYRL